jgi:tubulin epsilon
LPESQLISVDVRQGTSLANALIVRGSMEISDIRRNIDKLTMQLKMVSWNRDGWKTGLCDVPPLGQSYSVMALSNNSSISTILERLSGRFNKIFKRQAHLHHYLEYMDREDFISSIQKINAISTAYSKL